MVTTAILVMCAIVAWGIVKYVRYINHMESYFTHLKTKHKPNLESTALLGNMNVFKVKNGSEFTGNVFKYVLKRETPLKGNIGPAYFVAIDKPEDVQKILMSPQCFDKPYEYSFLSLPFGIVSERSGAAWKPLRKLMNPTFSFKVLQTFLPIFNEKTKTMVQGFDSEVGNGSFDVLPYASLSTLDSICSTVMGLNIDLKSNKGKEFINSLVEYLDSMLARFMKPWAHIPFIYKWTESYKTDQKHLANIRYFTNRVFDEKTKSYENAQNLPYDYESDLKNSRLPILSLYFEGKLSEEVVKQQIETLLMAGFETSASAVSFAILMIAMHQEIQEQAFDELRSIYVSQDEETTLKHIQKLHVLDRILKESMRLFPIGYLIGRTPTADIPLSSCVIPKGIKITILIFSMHRRREIWGDDANEFNPDHFLPENVEKRHSFAYIPFSGGPRNCIGHQYAMFSMKIILSAILRHFKLSTDLKMSDLELEFGIALKLANKHMIRVERRDWN